MGIQKTVFASKPERENYYKLSRTWGGKFRIYHNLPFLNVFTPQNLIDLSDWDIQQITLTETEFNQLKKTSIDYTLCDDQDTPILCIEFDGLQEGFNVGKEYHPEDSFGPYISPWRQHIMQLKLKVAYGSLFPYFIVGSVQFEDVTPQTKLTIVDGIIGEVLANRAKHEKFSRGIDFQETPYTEQEFNALPPWDQQEVIQDWVLGVEVEADMVNNPITQKRWEMASKLGIRGFRIEFLCNPPMSNNMTPKQRMHAFNHAVLFGNKLTLQTDDCGEVDATVWLPNFKVMNFSGSDLLEDLAFILASEKLQMIRARKK